jgi:hypothetical protein
MGIDKMEKMDPVSLVIKESLQPKNKMKGELT